MVQEPRFCLDPGSGGNQVFPVLPLQEDRGDPVPQTLIVDGSLARLPSDKVFIIDDIYDLVGHL
jgi:hypothetical protein